MKKAMIFVCSAVTLAFVCCKKHSDAPTAGEQADTTLYVKTPPPAVETPDTSALDSTDKGTTAKMGLDGIDNKTNNKGDSLKAKVKSVKSTGNR